MKEEKRILEHSIEEMLQVFNILMVQHRKFVEDCRKSDAMMDLLHKLREQPSYTEDSRIIKLASLVKDVVEKASENECKYKEV